MATSSFIENGIDDPLHPFALPDIEGIDLIDEEESTQVADEDFRHCVDDLVSKTDELEKKVCKVSEFFANKNQNISKGTSSLMEKQSVNSNIINSDNDDNNGVAKKPIDGHSQVVRSKRMQELMRQFGTILRQISHHKWAGPFMDPVDVKSLGLHDYYKIIKKPMDLSTIRKQLEAKDGTCYRNVLDIYADTRLVFTNAMTYNDERNDIHVMAKTLLAKLEEKWLVLWPKVVEEENRQKEEEAHALANMHVFHEAAIGKMASETESELNELNLQLVELREMVVHNCRKWSTEEKRKLGAGLCTLSDENLCKALDIIAQSNPTFQTFGEVVEFDMDSQSEVTLWRLKLFVKETLKFQRKRFRKGQAQLKAQEIYDDLTKADNKRSKKACLLSLKQALLIF